MILRKFSLEDKQCYKYWQSEFQAGWQGLICAGLGTGL